MSRLEKKRVLYDLTYAIRGKSGIPRDTITTAKLLSEIPSLNADFLLFSRGLRGLPWESKSKKINFLGDLLRNNEEKFAKGFKLRKLLFVFQSLTIFRMVRLVQLPIIQKNQLLNKFGLNKNKTNIYAASIPYAGRFISFKYLRPPKLVKLDYQVFLQQQVDPIRTSKSCLHVARLHDILPITQPHLFKAEAVAHFKRSLYVMLRHVDVWIFDTSCVEMQFKEMFEKKKAIESKVIPCVIESKISKVKQKRSHQILIVATIEPRKQIEMCIDAFISAKSSKVLDDKWSLVIAGGPGWLEDRLLKKLRRGSFGKKIVFIEDPSRSRIEELYSRSKFLISNSLDEGFGLPPLEGMAHGCIPIVSDIGSHRETMGPLPIYISENSSEAILEAIKYGLSINEANLIKYRDRCKEHVYKNYSPQVIKESWDILFKEMFKNERQ